MADYGWLSKCGRSKEVIDVTDGMKRYKKVNGGQKSQRSTEK
jgi:hypothetical protein